jgi:alanine dehydrogenase
MPRATTHTEPTFEVDGVIPYCVANMPGSGPQRSSHALDDTTLPFGLALADKGSDAIRGDRHLAEALNLQRGMITSRAEAGSLGMAFTSRWTLCRP